MPLVAIGALGAIGGVASSIIGSNAAGNAANAQVQAANNAANLQHQDAQDALNFEKQQYGNSLQMLNPYLQTGYGALGLLRTGLGLGGPNPQGFTLPTGTTNAAALRPSTGIDFGNFGGDQVLPMSTGRDLSGGGNLVANKFAGLGSAMRFGDTGANNAGVLPGAMNGMPTSAPPSMNTINGISPIVSQFRNPDANNFGAGNVLNATTNQGGTAQVPQTGNTGTAADLTAGGVDANGNPNIGFGSLLTPFTEKFTAPTDVTEQNDPGYQFRFNQGMQALQNSAAAKGGLFSGGTAKSLNDYAQGSASNEYSNVYNRALNEYLNRYNIFNSNQTNQFNRLASISGLGQTAGNQLSTAGLTTGNNVANTLLTSGQQIGQDYQNAGAARASGYVGSANAINSGISGITNMAQLLAMMRNNQSA